jgi:hypothetical protein
VIVVAVAVSTSLAATETLLRRHVIPTDPFDTARAVFHSSGTAIAAFGDSRVNDGIHVQPGLAKFAMPGDSLTTVLGKLEDWLSRNPGGRAIIGVPPHQFSLARLNAGQGKMLNDFLTEGDATLQILRPNHRRYLLSYLQVVIDDPGVLFRSATSNNSTANTSRSFAEESANTQRAQAQIRSQHHSPVPGFGESRLADELRRRLVQFQKSGAQLCLVTMPVTSAYRRAVKPEPNFAAVRTLMGEIAEAARTPYLDLWSDYPNYFFANADHLLPVGAKAVTVDILARCFAATPPSRKRS